MSSIILGNAQSDVLQGAQVTFERLFETYPGSGQGAAASNVQIGITAAGPPAGGSGTPLAATATGVTALSSSLYRYVWTAPASQAVGDYLVTWTGTVSSSTVTYVQTVTVTAVATGTPAPGVYATVAAYRAWSGDQLTPDAMVTVKLQRASEDIDGATIAAVYAVNANGMPTDAMVIDAFSRACCAQVQWLLANNDDAEVKRQYTSSNVGGVSVTRAAGAVMPVFPLLGPRAASILHTAGVLPSAVLVNW